MKLNNLLDKIREVYPEFLQYDWDNSGLNIGNPNADIKTILLTLDINDKVIDEAIEKNADLIISHHPFLFSKINTISFDTVKGSRIEKLIKNDISVYCMHTNYDVSENGLNDYLIELLYKELESLDTSISIDSVDILEKINSNPSYLNGKEYGLGRLVELNKSIGTKVFLDSLSKAINVDTYRYVGDIDSKIKKFAVVTGSGADYFEMAHDCGADLLITGDSKYHISMDALDKGIALADFGHYGTELIFRDSMGKFLEKIFGDQLTYLKSESLEDPYKYFTNN